MPISCPIKFSPISRDEYRKLDYQVMQHVFACHNELGRLCDEVIYQNDLNARLCAAGLGPIQINESKRQMDVPVQILLTPSF